MDGNGKALRQASKLIYQTLIGHVDEQKYGKIWNIFEKIHLEATNNNPNDNEFLKAFSNACDNHLKKNKDVINQLITFLEDAKKAKSSDKTFATHVDLFISALRTYGSEKPEQEDGGDQPLTFESLKRIQAINPNDKNEVSLFNYFIMSNQQSIQCLQNCFGSYNTYVIGPALSGWYFVVIKKGNELITIPLSLDDTLSYLIRNNINVDRANQKFQIVDLKDQAQNEQAKQNAIKGSGQILSIHFSNEWDTLTKLENRDLSPEVKKFIQNYNNGFKYPNDPSQVQFRQINLSQTEVDRQIQTQKAAFEKAINDPKVRKEITNAGLDKLTGDKYLKIAESTLIESNRLLREMNDSLNDFFDAKDRKNPNRKPKPIPVKKYNDISSSSIFNEGDDLIYSLYGSPIENPWFEKLESGKANWIDLLDACQGFTDKDAKEAIKEFGKPSPNFTLKGKSFVKEYILRKWPNYNLKRDKDAVNFLMSFFSKIIYKTINQHIFQPGTPEKAKKFRIDAAGGWKGFLVQWTNDALDAFLLGGVPGAGHISPSGEERTKLSTLDGIIGGWYSGKLKQGKASLDTTIRNAVASHIKLDLMTRAIWRNHDLRVNGKTGIDPHDKATLDGIKNDQALFQTDESGHEIENKNIARAGLQFNGSSEDDAVDFMSAWQSITQHDTLGDDFSYGEGKTAMPIDGLALMVYATNKFLENKGKNSKGKDISKLTDLLDADQTKIYEKSLPDIKDAFSQHDFSASSDIYNAIFRGKYKEMMKTLNYARKTYFESPYRDSDLGDSTKKSA